MSVGASHANELELLSVPATGSFPELPASWWPATAGKGTTDCALAHLVVRPMLGETAPLGTGLAVLARDVHQAVQAWSTEVPDLKVTIAGADTPTRRLETAWARLGYTTLAPRAGWRLLDLSTAPLWRLVDRPEMLSVRLPSLCFEPHVLVYIAQLGTHPTERMSGCLATMLGSLPESVRKDTLVTRSGLAALLLRLWAPDLCVLDARYVRRWDEQDAIDCVPLGRVIVGRDPLAVDAAGARLLGLPPEQVPLLRGVRCVLRRPWPELGAVQPLLSPPPPSRHFAEARLLEGIGRIGLQINQIGERMVRKVDLPRVIDFVRRVGSGR